MNRLFHIDCWRLPSSSVRRILLLTVSLALCFMISAGGAGAQSDDDHGDTFETATPLALGLSATGRIDTHDDVDYFKLDLSQASGTTDVQIHTTGELDTYGLVYDSDGDRVYSNDNDPQSGDLNFRMRAYLPSGIYYIAVYSSYRDETGDYTIHAEKSPADDHGNTPDDATTLSLGSTATGRIDPFDDRDVFKLDLSRASGLTDVLISTTGSLDTVGWLHDSEGHRVRSNYDPPTGRDRNFRIREPLPSGIYYITVYGYYGDIGDYTLHAQKMPPDDHGDTFDTATAISLESSVDGRIEPYDDKDIFKLDLSSASELTEVWVYTTGELDTVGLLYDSDGNLIDDADDLAGNLLKGTERNFHLVEVVPSGVYYVAVRNYWTQTGDYTLHIEELLPDDHSNTSNGASSLAVGSSATGTIDSYVDIDVFQLDLSGTSESADVWIYTTGDLDTLGVLSDSNNYLVTYNDDLALVNEDNFHLRSVLSPGVYYVWVLSYGKTTGDYVLHAEIATEPGSSIDTATQLTLDQPAPGNLATEDDADYFRLDFDESTSVKLIVSAADLNAIDVQVFDSKGDEISVNVHPVYSLFVIFLIVHGVSVEDDFEPGTYYIKVTVPEGGYYSSGLSTVPDDGKSYWDPIPPSVKVTDSATPYSSPEGYYGFRSVPYTILPVEDDAYIEFIQKCQTRTRTLNNPDISDPLYGCQWHLNNPEGEDINVEPAWAQGIKGEGVNVAVVDNGLDSSHEDLRENVDTERNHDYTGLGDVYSRFAHHGTHVAGMIAALDNDIGVRGVAPGATIYGYNLLAAATDRNIADSMARNRVNTAVSSNSWGSSSGPWLSRVSSFWEAAVLSGLKTGYYGKGTFYAFSGGNGHRRGDNSNLDERTNFYGVTAVCAVNDDDIRSDYSETGANLWICGPSTDTSEEHRGIVTTENSDRYIEDFGGTSAAAPVVAGVAALMRSANPDLAWRDLKLILAATARKNDVGNSGWENGARKYGSESDGDRYHFNHEYGFGVVNAEAAVDLAKEWTNASPLESATVKSEEPSAPIPDAPDDGEPTTLTNALTLNTSIGFTEFVEISVSFEHRYFRDLDIELVSPSGAVSKLVDHLDTLGFSTDGEFRFGSARHLGEDPNGVWQLRITDRIPFVEGTLNSWALTVYGHERRPGPPTVDWVATDAGSLTAGWTAPAQKAGLPVNSYDLRYLETESAGGSDESWNIEEGVWTVAAGGVLEHTITGLEGGIQYDIQVRAVNSFGAGPWSKSFTGTVMQSVCAAGAAVVDAASNPGLVSDCDALLASRDALAGTVALNWSEGTQITEWDGVIVEENRVRRLELHGRQLNGELPVQLGSLVNLEEIDLHDNRLSGPIPASLSRLINLQKLVLHGNDLNGEIPAELGSLPNLEWLYLYDNDLSGGIPAGLAILGSTSKLERLDIHSNQLSGEMPGELGEITSLTYLSLRDNGLGGEISPRLGELPLLESLYLGGNAFTGCIPSALRTLQVHDFDSVGLLYCDLDALVALYNSAAGESWDANDNWLSDEPVSEWYGVAVDADSRVTDLNLEDNGLSGQIPPEVGGLTRLTMLDLSRNDLSEPVPAELGGLINLETLDLSRNDLTGTVPSELGGLANLKILLLYINGLSGSIPSELGRLSNLEGLYLRDNGLTGAIPSELGALTSLRDLGLSDNELTGTIPSELGDLANLERLALRGNRLTGCIPEDLRDLAYHDFRYLNLPYCDVALASLTINPGTLTPAFAPHHNYYTAVVIASRITVTASNEHNASIQFLDGNYAELEDTDDSLDGHQVDLALGGNTVVVRVTSPDGQASYAYTIQVRWVIPPGAPTIREVSSGTGSLSIVWSTPIQTGSADITAYDLRYIRTDGDGTMDTNWTVVENAWSAGFGPLTYYLTGLMAGAHYDVQVRAVNPGRDSPWSETVNGTPGTAASSPCVLGIAVFDETNTGLVRECEALLAAKDVLAGYGRLNWSVDLPIVGWDGVTLSGTPLRVTELVLMEKSLTGRIPPYLDRLVNLEILNLSANRLTGTIPFDLGSLSNLRELDLSGNQLTGPLPTGPGNLSNLRKLDLSGNGLTGSMPSELGGLPNLRELDLSENRMTGPVPAELGRLSNLQTLDLSDNGLNGSISSELAGLSNLETLDLSGNALSGPIPSELAGLSNLHRLNLSYNQLTGPIPIELGGLSNLEALQLSRNRLTGPIPSELSGLSNLQQLHLNENRLTGQMPVGLAILSNLQQLYLGDNQLIGPVPSELGSLSRLEELYLGGNHLTGEIPSTLGNLANLRVLSFYFNELTGGIPVELADLAALESLVLSYNQLTGPIPTELGNLSNLLLLYLNQNRLTGGIPTELADLTALESLNLAANQLTGTIPPELTTLSNLRTLYLSRNPLTGCIPGGLRNVDDNDLYNLDLLYCDLLLSDLSFGPRPLSPEFDPYHTQYTTVSGLSRVTVGAVFDGDATVRFLVGDSYYYYEEITDADDNLEGHQVDIGPGVTTILVQVQPEDRRGFNTYTITVTYEDLLDRYDGNNDGVIDRDEAIIAIANYFNGDISRDEAIEVLRLYFSS